MEAWIIRIGLSTLGLAGFFLLVAPIDRAEPHSPDSPVFKPTPVPTKVSYDLLPSPSPVQSDYSYRRNEYEEVLGDRPRPTSEVIGEYDDGLEYAPDQGWILSP